jgi:hypothetical protein
VLVEEFGLTAVGDPDTARLLLQTKLMELDPFGTGSSARCQTSLVGRRGWPRTG